MVTLAQADADAQVLCLTVDSDTTLVNPSAIQAVSVV